MNNTDKKKKPAKLRKMLGDINAPCIKALMAQIETQSKETLAIWAVGYVETNFLPVYEKAFPENAEFSEIIGEVRAFLDGNRKLAQVKPFLAKAKVIAKEAETDPAGQAAARAISTACAVIQTPTNALGYTFYGAAAVLYDRLGICEPQEVYDTLAVAEFEKMLESLKKISVSNEKNPAKIKWGC